MGFINVAIPSPLQSVFTYAVKGDVMPTPGSRVLVEFRRKRVIGIVMEQLDRPGDGLAQSSIKPVIELFDEQPALSQDIVELIKWISRYYCAPIGEVCRAALPARLMQCAAPSTTRPKAPFEIEPSQNKPITLNDDQSRILSGICSAMADGNRSVHLIHGVTGSGKTEVYLRLFERLKSEGRQGLLLVPEIGLIPQLAGRAAERFGERVAVYHSALTDAQRHGQWMRMIEGDVDVVIGTRSALFAPLRRLGAIVVDEEHDASFKQDEGVAYHGRDAAVMRSHIEGICAVLGSATPSIESLANARQGKYIFHSLPSRAAEALMPAIELVDMRLAKRASSDKLSPEAKSKRREFHALSPQLYDAINETLSKGEQALLYIGRRGFAGALHCDSCGEVFICPNCDISLSAHIGRASKSGETSKLVCHYCDYQIPMPETCAACGSTELVPIGHGTQRLEAEIADFFPDAKTARLDSDAAGSTRERRRIFDGMRDGRIDILIGTQMVTKGHDFPDITLVGVISADQSLHLPDFRSAERTFQLITQVSGRAGRGKRPGRVIIQTHQPEHASLASACNQNWDEFIVQELDCRKRLCYPPFSRLANIRFSSNSRENAKDAAQASAEILCSACAGREASILGPAPAPIERLRSRYRWQILVKAQSSSMMNSLLSQARPLIEEKLTRGVRLAIDVDPVNML